MATKPAQNSRANTLDTLMVSVGNQTKGSYKAPKTDGVQTRGNGAATKGTKARGPMA